MEVLLQTFWKLKNKVKTVLSNFGLFLSSLEPGCMSVVYEGLRNNLGLRHVHHFHNDKLLRRHHQEEQVTRNLAPVGKWTKSFSFSPPGPPLAPSAYMNLYPLNKALFCFHLQLSSSLDYLPLFTYLTSSCSLRLAVLPPWPVSKNTFYHLGGPNYTKRYWFPQLCKPY